MIFTFHFSKIVLIIAWILFVYFAYRVSLIETEHKEYDPFIILDIDRVCLNIIFYTTQR